MLKISDLSVDIGKRTLIKNISAEAEAGHLIAIIGENGAGKSTLLNSLAGEIKYNGDVHFEPLNAKKVNIKNASLEWLAQHRAVMTQKHQIPFAFGLVDIVVMGRFHKVEPKSRQLSKVSQYLSYVELDTHLDRNTSQLSGGELQRLQFARCLSQLDALEGQSTKKLMLLDEPTSALDVRHQHRLLKLVKKFTSAGNTAIVVLHDLNLVSTYADQVWLLDQQTLQHTGTPESVLTEERLTKAYKTSMRVIQHPDSRTPIIFSEFTEH